MYIKRLNMNKMRRLFFFKVEVQLLVLKYIFIYKEFLKSSLFIYLCRFIFFLNPNFYFTRIKSICILTGRSGGVYRYFKVSRIILRKVAGNTLIYGVRRASW